MSPLLKRYMDFVAEHTHTEPGIKTDLLGPVGLSGEAGEVLELFKKHHLHGKPLDKEKLVNELGDVFWYFTRILINEEITLVDVIYTNMEKLNNRPVSHYKKGENNV